MQNNVVGSHQNGFLLLLLLLFFFVFDHIRVFSINILQHIFFSLSICSDSVRSNLFFVFCFIRSVRCIQYLLWMALEAFSQQIDIDRKLLESIQENKFAHVH